MAMPESPQETYAKLLVVLDELSREAQRVGDQAIREWVALAQLDAIDLGQQMGLLFDEEAERRREAVRAADPDLTG
jgi:hypothetical protein